MQIARRYEGPGYAGMFKYPAYCLPICFKKDT